MTTTTYTIHAAYDHAIVETANPSNLQETVAQFVAKASTNQGKRFYVHNGLGVVAAVLVRNFKAFDVLRDDYMAFDAKAREQRTEAGIANDDRT